MILRHVVLLLLSWPCPRVNAELQDDLVFDQLATASENVVRIVKKPDESRTKLAEQLIQPPIETTVHYENSNGFVPITAAPSRQIRRPRQRVTFVPPDPTQRHRRLNSTRTVNLIADRKEPQRLEDDPAYSTEARTFLNLPKFGTNRRSFDSQDGQNEFELLKVTNNTPAIANYQDFYEDVQGNLHSESDQDDESRTMVRQRIRHKPKRVQNYPANYGNANGKSLPYSHFYQQGLKDLKMNAYEQEKVSGNYHQQETVNYNGHGPTAAQQPDAASSSSLPRTNPNGNDLSVTTAKNMENHNGNFDHLAASASMPKTRYKFLSKPVVVIDPNQYKVDIKLAHPAKSSTPTPYTSRNMESSGGDSGSQYEIYNSPNRNFERDEESIESSDSMDYAEYTEAPKRMQKARRRPYTSENSRRLPKEHRTNDDISDLDDQRKRPSSSRTKSHRQKTKTNSWSDDDRGHSQQDSTEDRPYDNRNSNLGDGKAPRNHRSRIKTTTGWSQLSPNIEISHSSGIEIDALQKPKILFPVKVNLVPVTGNFDHATALGNSQGFDVSNAVLQSFVTASPINTVTTVSPMVSTTHSVQKQSQNSRNLGLSTPVPDIIVGQNSFQNQMQTLLFPQTNMNKFAQSLKPHYLSSTVSPVFAVTPTLQSLPIHNAVTPRPSYPSTTASSNLQHLAVDHMQSSLPHLLLPQPTIQTIANLLPVQTNSDYNIQVNPHGLQGQNLITPSNLQLSNMQTSTTTASPQTVTRVNLFSSENKKQPLSGNTGNFLATASLAVGHTTPKSIDYYLHNTDQFKPHLQEGLYQMLKDIDLSSKTKTYMLPVLQPHMSNHQSMQNSDFGRQLYVKNKMPSLSLQAVDSMGSHSSSSNTISSLMGSSDNAHLPHVGTKNVQIINPNIKPSPIDTTSLNNYGNMQHYPAAVLTTPIPIYSTTGFVAPVSVRPVLSTTPDSTNLQNFVDSLTEIGVKANQAQVADLKASPNQERPMFNPINFVPNVDVLKNQNALNTKAHGNEPLQQNLNLVPLVPGGNFFKPSFSAQSELISKPKLSSDLEKYAEQMFRESLKTIYNSHKWNNDRRHHGSGLNSSDSADLAKLRQELQKLKTSMSESKRNKEILEAHHSETKIRTAEPNKSPANSGSSGNSGNSGNDRKPDQVLLATLEQLLKSHPQEPIHIYHGGNKHNHNHGHGRPADHPHPHPHHGMKDFRNTKNVRNHPPPKGGAFHHKGHFHEKPKKRPGSGSSRYHSRGNRHRPSRPKNGHEPSASNHHPVHMTPPRFENFHSPYDRDFEFDSDHTYPTFTTSQPATKSYGGSFKEKYQDSKEYSDFNHPRMHNLLGLLMKNKQLPPGAMTSYFRDRDQLKQYFEEERQRLQQQLYDDTIRSYMQKKSDGTTMVDSRPRGPRPLSKH